MCEVLTMNSVVIPTSHRLKVPPGVKEQLALEFIWSFVSPKLAHVLLLLIYCEPV